MAVVSRGSSCSSGGGGGGKISFTADIASFRTSDESLGGGGVELEYDGGDDVEERSVTIDYYEDPPDETLRIILCDGETVAIQRHEGGGDFYGGGIGATADGEEEEEVTHEGFVLGDGSGGTNSAVGSNSAVTTRSNSDEACDVKVFEVLVRERQVEEEAQNYPMRRSSSVVTFCDEQNNGHDFMDGQEPLGKNGRPKKSALRRSASTTASSSSAARLPPNPSASPKHYPAVPQPPPGDATTDGEADLIFDYVEGDKRRERRRLNSARAKNRLLRKHCSNKGLSVCST